MADIDIEDLKIYFYDTFLSDQHLDDKFTAQGFNNYKVGQITMDTGLVDGGSAALYYDNPIFNPHYADLSFKFRMNDYKDCVAFFGYRTNLIAPTLNMTESHIGLLLSDGKLYFSSADGYNQQRVQISGLDLTKVYEFMISSTSLYIKPLPQVETYLGLPTIKSVNRVYTLLQTNNISKPVNQVHYIYFYVENTTNLEKIIYLNRVIYKEEYPD